MTQIMLRKLIYPRHKCSIRHAGGLVQTGFWPSSTPRTRLPGELAQNCDFAGTTE